MQESATRRVLQKTDLVAECMDGKPPHDWDAFVSGVPQGHAEQLSGWAAAERLRAWEASWVLIRDTGKLVGGAQILHRACGRLGRMSYVRCGPVFHDATPDYRKALVAALTDWTAEHGVRYLVVNLANPDSICVAELNRAGLVSKPRKLPPHILTNATLFIDLNASDEQILGKMRRERRREIRVASRSGFTFRVGGTDDLPIFYELLKMTAARQGCSPIPSSFAYLKALWEALSPAQHMRLFLIELAGDPVCAGVILPVADIVRFWRYGWNGEHSKLFPNALLYWKLIEWSRAQGFHYFDIVQIDSELAGRIADEAPLTAADRGHRLFGQTLFKMGFGGENISLPGPMCRFYPAWVNGLFRLAGGRGLGLNVVRRFMQRIE